MDRETTGSNRDARHMRASDFRSFKHFTPDGVQLSMGRVREAPGSHSSEPTLLEDAFVVTLPLRTYGSRIRRDARTIERFPFVKNVASFHDLHSHWSGHFVEGFDFLHFHVPRDSFAQGGYRSASMHDPLLSGTRPSGTVASIDPIELPLWTRSPHRTTNDRPATCSVLRRGCSSCRSPRIATSCAARGAR